MAELRREFDLVITSENDKYEQQMQNLMSQSLKIERSLKDSLANFEVKLVCVNDELISKQKFNHKSTVISEKYLELVFESSTCSYRYSAARQTTTL